MKEECKRECLYCGGSITGRIDKKFCCNDCKSMYHNQIYRNKQKEVRQIDRILKKNHAIIDSLYSSGKRTTSLTQLHDMGFNFKYITSLTADDTGIYRAGCYDYSYTLKGNDEILIDKTSYICSNKKQ
ncbi:MAG TPA: hypothetical protein IAC04_02875 [Candidatus Coprenecus stercoravium]|uniref:Uncharacterized protein n=1 Tax=Candidatus Coprenecus stercoravium TaxID=2840735 RepID=A0A9D2K926_9BACT|nr:hypothetical protein [Candidatus Coprenecus stercoravium]